MLATKNATRYPHLNLGDVATPPRNGSPEPCQTRHLLLSPSPPRRATTYTGDTDDLRRRVGPVETPTDFGNAGDEYAHLQGAVGGIAAQWDSRNPVPRHGIPGGDSGVSFYPRTLSSARENTVPTYNYYPNEPQAEPSRSALHEQAPMAQTLHLLTQVVQELASQRQQAPRQSRTFQQTFSGRDHENPRLFLQQLDRYLYDIGVTNLEEKSAILNSQLRDTARNWYESSYLFVVPYPEACRRLLERFNSPRTLCDLRSKLYGEHQPDRCSSERFINEKSALYNRLALNDSEEEKVRQIASLLRPDIRVALRGSLPFIYNLSELTRECGEIERDLDDCRHMQNKVQSRPSFQKPQQQVAHHGASRPVPNQFSQPRLTPQVRRCSHCNSTSHTAEDCIRQPPSRLRWQGPQTQANQQPQQPQRPPRAQVNNIVTRTNVVKQPQAQPSPAPTPKAKKPRTKKSGGKVESSPNQETPTKLDKAPQPDFPIRAASQ